MSTRFTRLAAATTLAGSTLVGGGVAGAHDDLPGHAVPTSESTAFTWLDPADATAYEAEVARFQEALAKDDAAVEGDAFDKADCDRGGDGVPAVAGAGWDRDGWDHDGWDGDHDGSDGDADGWDSGRGAGWGGGHHHR